MDCLALPYDDQSTAVKEVLTEWAGKMKNHFTLNDAR